MSLALGVFSEPGWGLESGVGGWRGEELGRRARGVARKKLRALGSFRPEHRSGRSPSAPRRQRRRGCSPSPTRRPCRAAPRAHSRLVRRGSEKEPPRGASAPAPPARSGLLRARVGFRFPAIVNSFVFVNRRWGHIPGSQLIVPSLPLSLRTGRRGWGSLGLGGGGVQTPKVRKCKHFLFLDRVSTSDSTKLLSWVCRKPQLSPPHILRTP